VVFSGGKSCQQNRLGFTLQTIRIRTPTFAQQKMMATFPIIAPHLTSVSDKPLELTAQQLGTGFQVTTHRYQDGPAAGMQMIELMNGKIAVQVLPQRGMGIHQINLPGWPICWQSPVRGPVNPALVRLFEPSGLGWLDGFDELLCRCGLSSNGAPEFDAQGKLLWPLHGRIANTAAHEVSVITVPEKHQLQLRGVVDEARFHFQKLRLTSTMTLQQGEAAVQITDEVTNFSAKPGEMELLYHINIGEPTLDGGSEIVAAAKAIVPRNEHAAKDIVTWNIVPQPTADYAEQVYFWEPIAAADGTATVLLKNKAGSRGVSVKFNVQQMPYFILWKNAVASADGFVVGLEPGINFPNPRSFEQKHGRVKPLASGETARFDLTFEVHETAAAVQAMEAAIKALQTTSLKLEPKPLANWCA
jgi:hypothetical protein